MSATEPPRRRRLWADGDPVEEPGLPAPPAAIGAEPPPRDVGRPGRRDAGAVEARPAEGVAHDPYAGGPVPPGARPGAPALPARGGAPAEAAPHGRRVLAAVLDVVALLLLAVPVGAVVLGVTSGGPGDPGGALAAGLLALAAYVVAALLYAPVSMALLGGRTPGKAAAGLRVVRERDGVPLGFGGAVVREVVVKGLLLGIASSATGGLALLADAVWPLVDERRRAVHDLVAGTRVVRG